MRRGVWLAGIFLAACSASPGPPTESPPISAPATTEVVSTTTWPQSPGTTTLDPIVHDERLAAAWARAIDGEVDEAFHPESLAIYGPEECRSWAAATGALVVRPTPWPREYLDDIDVIDLDGRPVVRWPTEAVHAQAESGTVTFDWDQALVDCGEPREGAYPILLAMVDRGSEDEGRRGFTLDRFEAPSEWYLDIRIEPELDPCHVRVVTESGEAVLDYTAYVGGAGAVEAPGRLRLEVGETCGPVAAYSTDQYLNEGTLRSWEPTPASVWTPHIYYPGETQEVESEAVVIANSGETAADLTGWTVENGDASEVYRFPDSFVIGPMETVLLYSACGDDTDSDLYWCAPGGVLWAIPVSQPDIPTLTLSDPDGNRIDGIAYGIQD